MQARCRDSTELAGRLQVAARHASPTLAEIREALDL